MEYVYSALVLHTAGKEINEKNIEGILKAAGVKSDAAKIKAMITSLEEVNIDEVLKSSVAMPVASAAPAAEPEKKEEGKKEDKKKNDKDKEEEVSEEEAVAGLGALFG